MTGLYDSSEGMQVQTLSVPQAPGGTHHGGLNSADLLHPTFAVGLSLFSASINVACSSDKLAESKRFCMLTLFIRGCRSLLFTRTP